jgi:archaetidylinositol phosphate synthase
MPRDEGALARLNEGLLSALEKRALAWLAPRVPQWLSPNDLTAIGFTGWIAAFAGYAMVPEFAEGLWLVNFGLIINWLGDSLDGEVARRRGKARPRFGYFLDQSIDAVGQLLFACGLALSGLVRPEIATLGLATYFMMTVQALLRAEVTRVFRLAAGGVGLTETRAVFFLVNALFYLVPPEPVVFFSVPGTYVDALGVLWIVANIVMYLAIMVGELGRLARQESPTSPGVTGSDREP